MAHRNRNDFDSTGDSSDAEDALGRLNDAEDLERTLEVDAGATASPPATAELERKLAEAQDRFLRQAAEYDNYRKRTIKERTELVPRAQADIVKQLLDPLDDLARFAHVDPSTVDPATVVQGAEMVEKKMLKALGAAGLEIVDPVNQSFDPQLHEAVATEPALSPEDDHVVARVYQVGYKFNGQLLRPARVVVKQWNG
jgi:molecular chaperone GrpE